MRSMSPWGRAAWIALGYGVAGAAYIYLSSRWAGDLGLEPAVQARVETLKGFGFVAVTGLALFAVLLHQFQRLHRAQQAVVERTHALGAAERRATTATVSAAVAHDMKNQLTVALASYDLLRDAALEGDVAEARDDLGMCLGSLRELSLELMARASQQERGPLGPVDVGRVAARAARLARFCTPHLDHAIVVELEDDCVVEADERDLEHAALNLVLNAVEATGGTGHVTVRVRREDQCVVLSVSDDGPGIPAKLREKVFEPFFSTKDEGSGLGLATVRQVVERFAGDIAVLPAEPRGSCFRVRIPATAARAA